MEYGTGHREIGDTMYLKSGRSSAPNRSIVNISQTSKPISTKVAIDDSFQHLLNLCENGWNLKVTTTTPHIKAMLKTTECAIFY